MDCSEYGRTCERGPSSATLTLNTIKQYSPTIVRIILLALDQKQRATVSLGQDDDILQYFVTQRFNVQIIANIFDQLEDEFLLVLDGLQLLARLDGHDGEAMAHGVLCPTTMLSGNGTRRLIDDRCRSILDGHRHRGRSTIIHKDGVIVLAVLNRRHGRVGRGETARDGRVRRPYTERSDRMGRVSARGGQLGTATAVTTVHGSSRATCLTSALGEYALVDLLLTEGNVAKAGRVVDLQEGGRSIVSGGHHGSQVPATTGLELVCRYFADGRIGATVLVAGHYVACACSAAAATTSATDNASCTNKQK